MSSKGWLEGVTATPSVVDFALSYGPNLVDVDSMVNNARVNGHIS